jgi:hypothetical protein
MSINYNIIKDLVLLLHKFVYKNDNYISSNYIYRKFDLENIKIDDLIGNDLDYQSILNSNYNTKENFKIKNIFGDIQFKKIILKKYFKEFPVTLIIQKYKFNENPVNITDITYELFMNQIITGFVIMDKIPFFLLNICNFNIKLERLSNYPDFYNLIVKEYNLFDPNDLESNFCFSIYEHYHSYLTFNELFKDKLSNDDLHSILFQLLYIYAYLQNKLDNFYHGEYNTNSFLIMKNDEQFTNIKLINNRINWLKNNTNINIDFYNMNSSDFFKICNEKFDIIYDRGCLHGNPELIENIFFKFEKILNNYGKIIIISSNSKSKGNDYATPPLLNMKELIIHSDKFFKIKLIKEIDFELAEGYESVLGYLIVLEKNN